VSEKQFFRVGTETWQVGKHEIGNKDCPDCWEKPYIHEGCGGLIHSEYNDEDTEGNSLWIDRKCDKCGRTDF
jgi:hypothetical protein